MFSAGSIVPPKTSIVQPKQPPVPDGQDPDRTVPHYFEGDGAVLGVTFSKADQGETADRKVSARYRYIRTVAFTNERKKGQRIYNSMDSTRQVDPASSALGLGNDLPLPFFRHHLQPGLNKNRKNTSNTRAIYWGKRLLSLWEGGLPYKLDSLAVSTEGRSQLGGAIYRETDSFGGKMVVDPKRNRALFHAVEQDPKKSSLLVYEFNSDFRLVKEEGGKVEVDVPGFAMLHDFCATDNYAVFVQPDITVNGVKYVVSKKPGEVLDAGSGPAHVLLVPRPGSSRSMQRLSIPSSENFSDANLQFVNAFEDGDNVVFDAIRSDGSKVSSNSSPMKWPYVSTLDTYRSSVAKKSLWRYTVNTRSGEVSKRQLLNDHCFFGGVNPSYSTQKHRYIYLNVGGTGSEVAPLQGIARYDTETDQTDVWMPQSHEFCGEPMYAAKMGTKDDKATEDSGYVMSVVFDGKRETSDLVILNASDLKAGPICRIPLGIAIPHGLFGCFTTAKEASWSADEIERRSKLADKVESRGNMWNEVKSDFSGLGLRFDDMEEYFGDFFS